MTSKKLIDPDRIEWNPTQWQFQAYRMRELELLRENVRRGYSVYDTLCSSETVQRFMAEGKI